MNEHATDYGRGFDAGQETAHKALQAWAADEAQSLRDKRRYHIGSGAAGAMLGIALVLSLINGTRR